METENGREEDKTRRGHLLGGIIIIIIIILYSRCAEVADTVSPRKFGRG